MQESLKLENQLCFVVYALSREIIRMYRPILKELHLTYTQYLVMICLWEENGMCLKDLGQMLCLDSGTLTPLLKKMEQEGFLNRLKDAKDERNLLIFLTDKGKELQEKAASIPEQIRCQMPLSDEEIQNLRLELKDILLNIQRTMATARKN